MRANKSYVKGRMPEPQYDSIFEDIERKLDEARKTERQAENTLSRPDEMMNVIKAATQAIAMMVRDFGQAPELQKELRQKGSLRGQGKLITRAKMGAGLVIAQWLSDMSCEDQNLDQRLMRQVIDRKIFDQKRQVLTKFVAAKGEIKVWSLDKFTITGALPIGSDFKEGSRGSIIQLARSRPRWRKGALEKILNAQDFVLGCPIRGP